MQMIKTIVIGAIVVGATVAYRLAQAGAAVTVLEATRIGGGTSGTSFAWTNARHKKPPKPYHDLNVAGMKAHAALVDEFRVTPWRHGGGSLEWEAEPDRTAQGENIGGPAIARHTRRRLCFAPPGSSFVRSRRCVYASGCELVSDMPNSSL